MGSWRTLPPDEVARLARALTSVRWSWSVAEAERVVAELGWTVAADPGPGGLVARTGLAPDDGLAEIGFEFAGDRATEISVPLTDGVGDGDARAADFRRDAFATAAQAVTAELGPPAQRRPGRTPQVRWSAPDGVLRLSDDGAFVSLALLAGWYAEALDAEATLPTGADADDGDEW